MATHQGSSQKYPEKLRDLLVKPPGVTTGTRFGGEAYFIRKRFFCHFHPTREHLFLETFVWNNVEAVVSEVPGTIPHPEYGGYGWVRLLIDSEDAVQRGRQLIETTYRYLRTSRRVSIAKEEFRPETLDLLRTELPEIGVKVKEAKKRKQVVLEARGVSDYEKADELLDKTTEILKRPSSSSSTRSWARQTSPSLDKPSNNRKTWWLMATLALGPQLNAGNANATSQRKRRVSVLLSCFIILMVGMGTGSVVPNGHAVASQSLQSVHPWTDFLSGGLWARLNNLGNNYSILDSAQAQARFASLTSGAAPLPSPPSLFTNNFRVTGNSSLFPYEDEPSIAVRNQTGQVMMVVGANSISIGQMASYVSTDQGTHWAGPTFLPLSKNNDSFASDPALGVNRTGTFYYAFLSVGPSVTKDDLVVATSLDGVLWTNHVAVQRRTFPSNSTIRAEIFDKEYIAVGPNKSNLSVDAVYVTYTDFIDYCSGFVCKENSTIMQVHSTNFGVTWSKPLAVSPNATITTFPTGRLVQGSMPAVGPNGDLYVAYYDSGKNGPLNASATVMIGKSTNGGVSFSPPAQAALIPQQLTYASQGTNCCFRWFSSMFPSMDVAPDGTVYIAYGARQSKFSVDPADVYLVASTDGGVTWSLPNMINDSTSQNGHFFAWLKVSSDGVVHIIWGDQRLDPVGLGYDIFYAVATNHGATISANTRVTDVGTDPLVTIGFVGDYFNMAVSGNQVYPVWTDGRRGVRSLGREILVGETDIFTARIGPRDAPSISLGTGAPAGYFAPLTVSGSGLPREAFFVMRMSGTELLSQKNGIIYLFSTKSGNLSDIVVPNSNYPGAYTVELDEWLSSAQLATATLYLADTRSLQVSIAGPPTASPGDTVTWNIQLASPSGSTAPQGFSSSFAITQALLTSPSGSVQNLTASVRSTGQGSYSVSATLQSNAVPGAYSVSVSASQTGLTVRSTGSGTTTLAVSSQLQGSTNAPISQQTSIIIVGVIAAIGVALQALQLARRRTGLPSTVSPSPTPPPA
jgi:hypothetical protein